MLNLKIYFIVFISTHIMHKESLDRLNNLDNVFIMEDMVLAHLQIIIIIIINGGNGPCPPS